MFFYYYFFFLHFSIILAFVRPWPFLIFLYILHAEVWTVYLSGILLVLQRLCWLRKQRQTNSGSILECTTLHPDATRPKQKIGVQFKKLELACMPPYYIIRSLYHCNILNVFSSFLLDYVTLLFPIVLAFKNSVFGGSCYFRNALSFKCRSREVTTFV